MDVPALESELVAVKIELLSTKRINEELVKLLEDAVTARETASKVRHACVAFATACVGQCCFAERMLLIPTACVDLRV